MAADDDSAELKRQLATAKGSARADLLNQLAVLSLDTALEDARRYAEEARVLAHASDDHAALARALKTLGVAAFRGGNTRAAIAFTEESLSHAEAAGQRRLIFDDLHNLAVFHRLLAEYQEALAVLGRALELADPDQEAEFLARAEAEVGTVNYLRGHLDQALTHCLAAVRIQERLGHEQAVATTLNTIAVIQDELGHPDTALDYYQQSMAVFERLGDLEGLVNPLNNIGVIHYARHELDQAEAAHVRALDIRRQLGDRAGEAVSLNNLGNVAAARDDLDLALARYQEALAIKEEIGDPAELAVTLRDIGDVERARGRLPEAMASTRRSLELARSVDARTSIKAGLLDLATIAEQMGDHRSALAAYKEFHATEKKILDEESSKHLAELQARFESERKEREIERLRQQSQLGRQRQQLLVAAVCLALLLTAAVLNRYRLKAKANRLLAAKQETIAAQNRRLEELNLVLAARSEQYYTSSIMDQLTGTYNKAYILDVLAKTFSFARRHDQPLACVFLDLDHFKLVNDTWGHLVGDRVLARVAKTIHDHVRAEDILGRYGGEEFLLVLPNTTLAGARRVADKIIFELPGVDFEEDGLPRPATISAGVAEAGAHAATSADELVHMADSAMYLAKEQGRNRVCEFVVNSPPPTG